VKRGREPEHDPGRDGDRQREAERRAVERTCDSIGTLTRRGAPARACRRSRRAARGRAPLHDSTMPSVSICASSRPRPAPSAVRIAISFCRRGPRQQQVRQVGADDQHDDPDRAGQHPQREPHPAVDLSASGLT
jgi:hypothetical protein